MFAADTYLQIRSRLAPSLHADLHQLTDSLFVQDPEGILLYDAVFNIEGQESSGIVPAETAPHLG